MWIGNNANKTQPINTKRAVYGIICTTHDSQISVIDDKKTG